MNAIERGQLNDALARIRDWKDNYQREKNKEIYLERQRTELWRVRYEALTVERDHLRSALRRCQEDRALLHALNDNRPPKEPASVPVHPKERREVA